MPLKSIADGNPAFKRPLFQLSRFLTPRRFRKSERKAFTTHDFEDVLRSIAERQYEYIGWPRKNSVRVLGYWVQTLAPSDAHLLNAANVEARISFAKIAVHEVLRVLEDYAGPVCFFSVCPRRYVLPLCDAHRVDLRSLKKLTGQVFASRSLVGSVDFALFKGFGRGGIRAWHNLVGAHTHGLVWGASAEELRASFAAMGPSFINVKGECAGYAQEIGPDEIAGYMRYALKLPLFEYNVRAEDDGFDPDTGEIFRTTKVSPNPLRPGDQLRMAALLRDMSLDHLIFGQHEGTGVVREIRRRARLPIVQKNEFAALRGRTPDAFIDTDEIPFWKRTPVATLIQNPPRKVWLGEAPEVDRVEPFLLGCASVGAVKHQTPSLPELVLN